MGFHFTANERRLSLNLRRHHPTDEAVFGVGLTQAYLRRPLGSGTG